MRFGSVCSGIEAASVAWHPLGWQAAWVSEIEPFPCAVLKHHYPTVPNLGDMATLPARIRAGEVEAPDLFCGGTPCQAFSVAGLRRSLDDARGNLSLTFCEIANEIDAARSVRGEHPCIVFWENVPGVLNTRDNALGCFLAGLAGEGEPLVAPGGKWGDAGCVFGPSRTVAWRVLDAQYFGLAQRRRRVFVVASARAKFDPVQVLFEFEGVRRDTAPSREARKVAPTIPARSSGGGGLGTDFDCDGGVITMAHGQGGAEIGFNRGPTLTCNHEAPIVAHSLRGEGFDASDGTGRGTPLVTVAHAFDARQSDVIQYGDKTGPLDTDGNSIGVMQPVVFQPGNLARGAGSAPSVDVFPTLNSNHGRGASDQQPHVAYAVRTANTSANGHGVAKEVTHTLDQAQGQAVVHPVAFTQNQRDEVRIMPVAGALAAEPGAKQQTYIAQQAMQVRRLTPTECERLQGFPDGYTAIPWRGKPASECPDGPRYKALGNSWAVPCVRWIGWRIADALTRDSNG